LSDKHILSYILIRGVKQESLKKFDVLNISKKIQLYLVVLKESYKKITKNRINLTELRKLFSIEQYR
ncbi:hypothetical protein C1645_790928, partial [Glomus cerebriforme]